MINMKEKKNIRVLDDIYWKDIIYELKFLLPDYNFPIYTKLNGTIYYGKDFNIRDTYAEDNSFSNKNIKLISNKKRGDGIK